MSGAFHDAALEGVTVDAADFVIVGSGAGGGAAARTLTDAGYSVIVLEDGPMVTKDKVSAIAAESMQTLFRHGGQMGALGNAIVPIMQGRCVGGTTFVNSAIIWRLPEKVLANWRTAHGLGDAFPDEELESAYQTLERDMSVRPVGDKIATGSDRIMHLASIKVGLESRPIHRNEKDCKGSGRCFHGCPNDAKQSTAINYLRRAVETNAHVFAHAKVERVLTERGRATGVLVVVGEKGPHYRKKFKVMARRAVIISGSVFGSPNLLRRSGIALQSSALGNHFQAHPGTAIVGLYKEPKNMWSGAAQGYETFGLRDTLGVKLESINVPLEVAASRLPGAGQRFARYIEKMPYMAAWSLAVRADAEGTVRPSWLMGEVVRYSLTPGDLDRVRKGAKKLTEMHFAVGATEVMPGIHGLPERITSPDQLSLFDTLDMNPRNFSMVATHLFGTCRAGTDPRTSVVDPSLKVHGVEGLYVMDASVFPTNTGVNPQHSIMALTTVAAKRLAGVSANVSTSSESVREAAPQEKLQAAAV